MIVSAHVAERTHDRRFIYARPAICASLPALILVLALGANAMGGVIGALIVCSLVWRAYCAERKRGEKRSDADRSAGQGNDRALGRLRQ